MPNIKKKKINIETQNPMKLISGTPAKHTGSFVRQRRLDPIKAEQQSKENISLSEIAFHLFNWRSG